MQRWKQDKSLYDCDRDENNKKKLDYYDTYIKEFLSADPVRDWESIDRCIKLWKFLHNKYEFRKKKFKVLDCGTKDGQFTQWLNNQGHECVGIEIDQQYVDFAKSKNRNVIYGDICNINYKWGTFDVVFAHHVLGLCPDIKKAISEMLRVTKNGGIVIFLIQIPGNPRKHYSLLNSVQELNDIINSCARHEKIYNDFWWRDEHVTIIKKG